MSSPYTVKSRDNLSLIARQHDLKSCATLRSPGQRGVPPQASRPQQDLSGGDVLMIPGGDSPSPPLPPPPVVPRPVLLQRQDAEQAVKNDPTREMRCDVVSVLVDHPANLIVFGETHFTFDPFKAFFLSELIRPVRLRQPLNTHFHASERFPCDLATRSPSAKFCRAPRLKGAATRAGLPRPLEHLPAGAGDGDGFPELAVGVLGIERDRRALARTSGTRPSLADSSPARLCARTCPPGRSTIAPAEATSCSGRGTPRAAMLPGSPPRRPVPSSSVPVGGLTLYA